MAKKCPITGKGPMVGNNVSHANNKTKRRFLPNLQYKRYWLDGEKRFVRIRVTTRGMRIIDKHGIEAVLKDIKLREQAEATR
jgi:large subunit ribosomal protein L28